MVPTGGTEVPTTYETPIVHTNIRDVITLLPYHWEMQLGLINSLAPSSFVDERDEQEGEKLTNPLEDDGRRR